jgi:hypothetical protein
MKSIFNRLFLIATGLALFAACKKDEARVNFLGGTPPVLTASVTDSVPLSFANAAKTAIVLSWTNPNYQFNTGVSSMDVTYLVEIDTAGANFTNPNRKTISVSKDLSLSISVGDFNDYLLNQLVLAPGVVHNLEIRVSSMLTNNTVSMSSGVIKLNATPYAIPPKVPPPSSGNLFLVGSATSGGWNNPVPVPNQEFTQLSPTTYTITITLSGGQEYLFLPVNGSWSHKYAVKDKTVSGLSAGGDFGYDLSDNFPGPVANGTYKIDVDFQRGKFTVTKQ